MIKIDELNWVNKDDVSSFTIVAERDNKVEIVLYVGRRTISVDVKKSNLQEFLEKFA